MKARIYLNRQQLQELIDGQTVNADGYVDSHVERITAEICVQDTAES